MCVCERVQNSVKLIINVCIHNKVPEINSILRVPMVSNVFNVILS